MAELVLSNGMTSLVDDDDFERVSIHAWHYIKSKQPNGGALEYAARKVYVGGSCRNLYLHRFLLDAPAGIEVDHANGNGLDNRRNNIRLATRSQNEANKVCRMGRSGFRGVLQIPSGKWRAQIEVNQVVHRLGYFGDAITAAKEYDAAARLHFGEFARLNFPNEGEQGCRV